MNYFALVNDGLEQTAEQEIKEKLKVKAVKEEQNGAN